MHYSNVTLLSQAAVYPVLSGNRLLKAVLLAELINTPGRVHDFLLTRIKRMALRTNVKVEFTAERRSCLEFCSATARHRNDFIFGMNIRLHTLPLLKCASCGRGMLAKFPRSGKGEKSRPLVGIMILYPNHREGGTSLHSH